ncbi:MAG TPA: dihydroorotate dehydrogenase (quinone) [Anaerolineales bacterium]|nr:dihydroorotate dehydrogenase (quinone) [Anaerolineales bacterium]
MYKLIRPLLFHLEPETAHRLTLQTLRFAGKFPPSYRFLEWLYRTPPRPVHAFGLSFKNPIGLAAGYDKDAVAVRGLAALGFGHLELGTVTPRPQPGNPRPRLFRLIEDEAVINRLGFPSRGAAHVVKSLKGKRRRRGVLRSVAGFASHKDETEKPVRPNQVVLGVNLGKNKDIPNEEAVLDYLEVLQCFAPYADYLTINISSPNTVGLRQLQGRDALEGLLSQLDIQRGMEEKSLEKRIPLLVKLGPDLSEQELDNAVEVILRTRMDGIIATNTTLAREGLESRYRGETGGLSGSPLRVHSEAVLCQVVKRVDGKIPIVSVGGILHPDDAKKRFDLGATLIQIYTGLVYHGPGLIKKILTG